MYQVSCVTYHVSHVTCQMSHILADSVKKKKMHYMINRSHDRLVSRHHVREITFIKPLRIEKNKNCRDLELLAISGCEFVMLDCLQHPRKTLARRPHPYSSLAKKQTLLRMQFTKTVMEQSCRQGDIISMWPKDTVFQKSMILRAILKQIATKRPFKNFFGLKARRGRPR